MQTYGDWYDLSTESDRSPASIASYLALVIEQMGKTAEALKATKIEDIYLHVGEANTESVFPSCKVRKSAFVEWCAKMDDNRTEEEKKADGDAA